MRWLLIVAGIAAALYFGGMLAFGWAMQHFMAGW